MLGGRIIEDFLNKLAVQLSREFPNTVFVFEDLNKSKMFNNSKNFNRKLSRSVWGKIIQKLYRVKIKLVNPAYTSSTCPWEYVRVPKGAGGV